MAVMLYPENKCFLGVRRYLIHFQSHHFEIAT